MTNKRINFRVIICVAVSALTSSCAWKGQSIPAVQSSSTVKQEVKSIPPSVPEVSLKWLNRLGKAAEIHRLIESDHERLKAPLPVILPQELVDQIEVSIYFDNLGEHKIESVVAHSMKDPKSAFPTNLEISEFNIVSNQRQQVTFKVSGLKEVFKSKDEPGHLKIELLEKEGVEVVPEIELVLATPPTQLTFAQQTLKEYEGKYGEVDQAFKNYEIIGKKLKLIQVIQIENEGNYAVSAYFPFNLKGVLRQRIKINRLFSGKYSYSLDTLDTATILSGEIYLLPLQVEVAQEPSNFFTSSQKKNEYTLPFLPREEKLLGIYVRPMKGVEKRFSDLEVGKGLESNMKKVKALKSRTSYCNNSWTTFAPNVPPICSNYPREVGYNDDFGDHYEAAHWPGKSKLCWIHADCYLPPENQKDQDACNECAEWDMSLGLAKSEYKKRYCWSLRPQFEGEWKVVSQYDEVEVGQTIAPVELLLSPENTTVSVHFALGVEGEEQPRRVAGFLNDISVGF